MLEKHQPQAEPVWDIDNLWLAFLFLCLCWVAIMVVIIHRDVINQTFIQRATIERVEAEARLTALRLAEPQSDEIRELEGKVRSLADRIRGAESPPTLLFMVFAAFEAMFILAYYLLLVRLRPQIRSVSVFVYLLTLPLGFVYFFLFITIGRYHSWSELFGDFFTTLVALYFAGGLVYLGGEALLRGRRASGV
ncbi:MAG: hypothetical protein HUU25_01555 [Candidatus Sumerlaeia bacterium]|nr:hypothetical protein [Candidatus Sumerlaeia bacterium]